MAKDSYYFPHDYNARNDRKIAALIQKHKAAGYGVFWITCEMMHEEGGTIEFDEITFGAIAKDSNEDVGFVKSVISDCITEFKLFKREEDIMISGRVSRNLEHRKEISKTRSAAGKRSANARQMSTNVEQNPTKKGKEIKEKENIVNKEALTPKMVEVFKKNYPYYPVDEQEDFSSCLSIAYKIAKQKGWDRESVLNGNMGATLEAWEKIVLFSTTDKWYATRSISDFNREFQRIVQGMVHVSKKTVSKEEEKSTAAPLKVIKHE